MTEFRTEGGKTYRLEAVTTDCTCETCDDLRSAGCQAYGAITYLGEMMIGCDCGASSEEEAIDSAEVLYQMFHMGELGTNAQEVFTAEAIKQVRSRRA